LPDKPAPAFSRIVVALNGGPSDRPLLRLVLDLAKPARAHVVAVHVVELDWTLPLDANVAQASEEAQRVLDLADAQAEHAGVTLDPVLVQARDVGAALVDEAVEQSADLLVLGLPYRKKLGGDFAIGRTVPYVLKNAPCAVWVAREPMPEEYRP
jgi:nucleotide-binding universal stress UspA family protein